MLATAFAGVSAVGVALLGWLCQRLLVATATLSRGRLHQRQWQQTFYARVFLLSAMALVVGLVAVSGALFVSTLTAPAGDDDALRDADGIALSSRPTPLPSPFADLVAAGGQVWSVDGRVDNPLLVPRRGSGDRERAAPPLPPPVLESPPMAVPPPPPPPPLPPSSPSSVPAAAPSRSQLNTSTVSSFLASGGRFPVVVLAGDRADMLHRTLRSLVACQGLAREALFVLQHGSDGSVSNVIRQFGLRSHQNLSPVVYTAEAKSKADKGGERIAQHYRYSLTHMFDVVTAVRCAVVAPDRAHGSAVCGC